MKHTAVAFLILTASAANAAILVAPSATTVAQGSAITFTITVSPAEGLQQVILTYEGESVQDTKTAPPFEFTHTFNTPMDGLTITATARYNTGTEVTAAADIDVVGLVITGASAVTRGWPTTFTATSATPGKTASGFTWSFKADSDKTNNQASNTYADPDSDGDGKSSWGGTMVDSGVFTCGASVGGVFVETGKTITITRRNWTTPITCVQDNEPDWGDVPTDSALLGENRDRDSNLTGYVYVPRNGKAFTPARTLATVYAGPCAGLWYVYSSTLKCQRETVINKYIKSTGPSVGGKTFVEVNTEFQCFNTSPDDFLQAVMNHEYRGTPDTFKSLEGHQGRTEKCIRDTDWNNQNRNCDAKQHIEGLLAWSSADLDSLVDETITADESAACNFLRDEEYSRTYGPNWGYDLGSLGEGMSSLWSGTYWTDCFCSTPDF